MPRMRASLGASARPMDEVVSIQRLAAVLSKPVSNVQIRDSRELDQSEVARLDITVPDAAHPITLHYKKYDMKQLMARVPKPPEKWRISALSFDNEYQFLAHAQTMNTEIARFLQPAGGQPQTLYSHSQVDAADWFDRKYTFLTEYLPHERFYQAHQLDLQQARAALTWLARFHAYWWIPRSQPQPAPAAASPSVRTASDDAWRSGLFKRGAWWRKDLRPSVRYERTPAVFQALCKAFPDLFSDMDTPLSHAAMQRLTDSIDMLATAITQAPDRTLVHGDFKTSNLFISRPSSSGGASQPDVYAIDFQWVGSAPSGLADVVYCMYAGVCYDALSQPAEGGGSGETALLRLYHHQLSAALTERGLDPAAEMSWEDMCAHTAVEILAYAATAIPQLMEGLTPEVCKENTGKFGWLTHEEDARCAALLCQRALAAWEQVEAAGGIQQLLAKGGLPLVA